MLCLLHVEFYSVNTAQLKARVRPRHAPHSQTSLTSKLKYPIFKKAKESICFFPPFSLPTTNSPSSAVKLANLPTRQPVGRGYSVPIKEAVVFLSTLGLQAWGRRGSPPRADPQCVCPDTGTHLSLPYSLSVSSLGGH